MAKEIYVGNLSYSTEEGELQKLFGEHGTVESVNIIIDRDTGRSKGFGFVKMASDEEAKTAIAALDGKELNERQLKVNEAKPREQSDRGGRGGRGGGGGGRGRF